MQRKNEMFGIVFVQAEDGIRDKPRSRGLGDVYKGQEVRFICPARLFLTKFSSQRAGQIKRISKKNGRHYVFCIPCI